MVYLGDWGRSNFKLRSPIFPSSYALRFRSALKDLPHTLAQGPVRCLLQIPLKLAESITRSLLLPVDLCQNCMNICNLMRITVRSKQSSFGIVQAPLL